MQDHDNTSDQEQKIRDRAYALWEQEGRPEGREHDHWHQAHREITGNDGRDGGAHVDGNGLSSGLQPGGTMPGGGPGAGMGSIGTGGGSTANQSTGSQRQG